MTSRRRRSAKAALRPARPRQRSAAAPSFSPRPARPPAHSANRLLTTVLSQIGGKRLFALEGSVFVAGSMIKWLRDGLGWIDDPAETEALARDA